MIVLTVLFGAFAVGGVLIGVLALRVRRAADALARQVARASGEHRTEGAQALPLRRGGDG
ncbi:hypothetical protein ACOQFV_21220 [Nocardiopsis changdeensis]|uniref:Sensor histidine kinase n=1 Tax=Nocardiopsis changdeensis TaxID=2831969 RepID=A0ABX8BJ04_9ACTN|nr:MULTISPECIES: hypothetical protein [Nocardiopsis]QUX20916.1 hypothetical protein KGD84_20905 [Nocardiopsis changdeensis]QYX36847.1 hypothetical protein K1J57_30360 [Nocardiopsis sp. MT53]